MIAEDDVTIHLEIISEEKHLSPEERLFREVIKTAQLDAFGRICSGLDRLQARRWLLHPERDFKLVCCLAGYEWEFIRDEAKRLLKAEQERERKATEKEHE